MRQFYKYVSARNYILILVNCFNPDKPDSTFDNLKRDGIAVGFVAGLLTQQELKSEGRKEQHMQDASMVEDRRVCKRKKIPQKRADRLTAAVKYQRCAKSSDIFGHLVDAYVTITEGMT